MRKAGIKAVRGRRPLLNAKTAALRVNAGKRKKLKKKIGSKLSTTLPKGRKPRAAAGMRKAVSKRRRKVTPIGKKLSRTLPKKRKRAGTKTTKPRGSAMGLTRRRPISKRRAREGTKALAGMSRRAMMKKSKRKKY